MQITSGTYSTQTSGNNLIVTVGTGKITLKGVTSANIIGKYTEANKWRISGTTATYGTSTKTLAKITGLKSGASDKKLSLKNQIITIDSSIVSSKGVSVSSGNYAFALSGAGKMVNVGAATTLKGSSGADTLVSSKGDTTLIGGDGNDAISVSNGSNIVRYASGDGSDVVTGLSSTDTLHITNGKIASSVFSGKDLSFKIGNGNITLKNVKGSSFKLKMAGNPAVTFTAGDDIVEGITLKGSTVYVSNDFDGDEIDLIDYSPAKNVYAATFEEDLHILGTGKNNSLVGGKGDDLIEGGEGRDTLTGGRGDDVFVHTGGKDIITDYTSSEDKIQLENGLDDISSTKYSGNNLILTTATGSITVKGGKGKSIVVVDDQGNEESVPLPLPKYLTYNSNKAMVTAAKNYSGVIDVTAYSQTQKAKIVDASAVTNNVEIIGNSLNNSIIAGSGDDSLYGGKGTDTLTGGSGEDLFMHTGGRDIITDYTVGEDTIYLGDGVEIKSAKLNVKDVVLTTSTGSITIKNGKNKKITVMDADGDETTKIYPVTKMTGLSYNSGKTVLTVKKSFAGETIELADYASSVKTVNAKASPVKVEIIGNKLNNSLVGGNYADTLGGLKGNDTLTGGKGSDVFIYTTGTDVITDYKQGEDKIQLDDGVDLKSWKISGSNVVFTTSAGKFTVKDGKNKKITIVDDEGKSTTKKYSTSGSANVAELFAENNFATADNLSSIVENNLAVSADKIEAQNFDTLTQKNSVITFADK